MPDTVDATKAHVERSTACAQGFMGWAFVFVVLPAPHLARLDAIEHHLRQARDTHGLPLFDQTATADGFVLALRVARCGKPAHAVQSAVESLTLQGLTEAREALVITQNIALEET